MPWDPELYHRFQAERSAPFIDTQALIQLRPGMRVIDLGCGTGELTRRLADRLPDSEVLGIDTSPEMLAKAAAYARPGLHFEQGNLQSFSGQWDLIFSHAAIHWVEDHPALLRRFYQQLNPGGQFVIQMPSNHNHPVQRAIITTAQEQPFIDALQGWYRTAPVLPINEYAEILYALGAHMIVVIEKIYPHVLPDADAVADWSRGTALVPYMERLSAELQDAFMQRYREHLRVLYPQTPVFYGFRRTLLAGTRPA